MNLPTVACRNCAAPVAWVITQSGAHMPVDPEPDAAGNVYVTVVADAPRAKVVSRADPRPVGTAYTPHFATCTAINDRLKLDGGVYVKGRLRKAPLPKPPKPVSPLELEL